MATDPHVIAVINQKGGCGKSTLITHLAAALGELGHRVLVVDLDSNSGATRAFGFEAQWLGTAELLLQTERFDDVVLKATAPGTTLPKGVDLLPARRNLETLHMAYDRLEEHRQAALGPMLGLLAGAIERIAHARSAPDYDYILLDTAPNVGTLTMTAYWAASWFIISTEPAKLSFDGLIDAIRDVVDIKSHGAQGRLLGIVLGRMTKRSKLSTDFARQAEDFGNSFRSHIHHTVKIPQGQAVGKTLFTFAPSHAVTNEFRSLALEVLARIAEKSTEQEPAEQEHAHG